MTEISIIFPTRNRPDAAKDFIDSIFATAHHPEAIEVLFYIDADEPQKVKYIELVADYTNRYRVKMICGKESLPLSHIFNYMATWTVGNLILPLCDDMLMKTQGWDIKFLSATDPSMSMLIYCDDGIHGQKQACALGITRRFYKQLGYIMYPKLKSGYGDTWLHDISKRAGCCYFLKDVLIQHLHPCTGLRKIDETFSAKRRDGSWKRDATFYKTSGLIRRNEARKIING